MVTDLVKPWMIETKVKEETGVTFFRAAQSFGEHLLHGLLC